LFTVVDLAHIKQCLHYIRDHFDNCLRQYYNMTEIKHITKLFNTDQYTVIKNAIEIISELTGEDFIPCNPPWLEINGLSFSLDGYSEKLKLAIESVGYLYELPQDLEDIYNNREEYAEFIEYTTFFKQLSCGGAGIIIIPIPEINDKKNLRLYLRNQLHRLTKYRVWVGSPRCKCPSKMIDQ
jgi:hypothetical protein